jgi:hypothetical protein
MKYTLIDHDNPLLALGAPYGNRAIIQFESHEKAQEAFRLLLKKLSFESNRVQYILGRSIVINRLSDREYGRMLRVLEQG